MDWFRAVDGYCERLDATFWSEPVNAVTNLGFVLMALWLWPQVRGVLGARVLCGVLAMIGIGSWLFHTHAQVWAGLLDVAPIAGFVFFYIYLANRSYWGWSRAISAGGLVLFVPYAAIVAWGLGDLPVVGGSALYISVAVLIALYAAALRRRLPEVARGLAIGAGLLFLSITFRAVDGPLCDLWPIGTHFLWHLLNAVMLGWMIVVYHRHMVAGGGSER